MKLNLAHLQIDSVKSNIDSIQKIHFPEHDLDPIYGAGSLKPDTVLVFINPTKRNISSNPNWKGLKAPWIGYDNIWKFLVAGKVLDLKILDHLPNKKDWNLDNSLKWYNLVSEQKVYITNIVKLTGHDATLPTIKIIKLYLEILKEEIQILKPKRVIAFGQLSYSFLMDEKIKFKEIYQNSMNSGKPYSKKFNQIPVFPCYFPVGLGKFNMPKALDLLHLISLHSSKVGI